MQVQRNDTNLSSDEELLSKTKFPQTPIQSRLLTRVRYDAAPRIDHGHRQRKVDL